MNESRFTAVEKLVSDCIMAHQETIIVQLIVELEKNYKDIAKLSTFGQYQDDWTHEQVLDYITKET